MAGGAPELVVVAEGVSALGSRRWREYRSALAAAGRGRVYELLRALRDRGLLRAVVCVGDDPGFEAALGRDHVVYVYGSPWRLRCRGCGRAVRVDARLLALEEPPRCPGCGARLEPEPGAEPSPRALAEALGALLSATHALFAWIRRATYLVTLMAVAAARSGVEVYCGPGMPEWVPCRRVDPLAFLEELASAHGR